MAREPEGGWVVVDVGNNKHDIGGALEAGRAPVRGADAEAVRVAWL